MNLEEDKPQDYVLLVAHTPEGPRHIHGFPIDTKSALDFLLDVSRDFPGAYHVGFGFGYDANQIVRGLTVPQLEILHKTGFVYTWGREYRIEWRKGKSFTVTRYGDSKQSVVVYDVWSFFTTTFVGAVQKFLGDSDDLRMVVAGKEMRQDFARKELDTLVLPYCETECRLLVLLMERFREIIYGAGFKIRRWHGPGAIASTLLRERRVHEHMTECPEPVQEASRIAYAAGRFEDFKMGRMNAPVWGLDINSAYPTAIAQLPSLRGGMWKHVIAPTEVKHFAVYHVRSLAGPDMAFSAHPAPLFHRDQAGRIAFPWHTEGWYWSPEVRNVMGSPLFEVIEGWEFEPLTDEKPFHWIPDMYSQRQEWKRGGNPAEYALKLALNSIYGKQAQRVGWDQENRKGPRWHQLEWAGWVTSYCRAKLYAMMVRLGLSSIVAVETDGIYTLTNPEDIGLSSSKTLGEWSIVAYQDVLYLQSGLAWSTKYDGSVEVKSRGLDIRTAGRKTDLSLGLIENHLRTKGFDPIPTTVHRFVGVGAALRNRYSVRSRHCRWETVARDIVPGGGGKRLHIPAFCPACGVGHREGNWSALHSHTLVNTPPKPYLSKPHHLPWLRQRTPRDMEEPAWRKDAEYWSEMLREV